MAKTILRFDLNLFGSEIDLAEKYDGGFHMIHLEGTLTIPLFKPEISADKRLASASLPCWVAFDYYCLVSCCFCVFLENLEECGVKTL